MRPTRPSHLGIAFVVAGIAGFLLVSRFYGVLPRLSLLPLVTIGALALVEAYVGRLTRARIARRRGTRPIEPLVVARLAVLAKASSMGGSLFAGAYVGALTYVLAMASQLNSAAADIPVAIAGAVVCVLLVAAALWLEHCCRIPDDRDTPTTRR